MAASGEARCCFGGRKRSTWETRAWYGMFPQLGAPLGFLLSGGTFLALSNSLTDERFFSFGWRIPFLASAALVLVGLYVRLTISETPVFRDALSRRERVKLPMLTVFRKHSSTLLTGTLISLATFVVFYLMTVFALSWGTTALGYSRGKFLVIQLFGMVFFALAIPISALLAERGRRRTLLWVTLAIGAFGLISGASVPRWNHERCHDDGDRFIINGPHLWPARHGALRAFSDIDPLYRHLSSVQLRRHFRRLVAPYIATWLAKAYGLQYVGYYVCVAAALSFIGLLATRETKDDAL